ncbi:MAG: hypothetical protein GX241_07915 [Ruminococcaceae bacterium]|nr:hypothetical protein [Oscillospiraceae bacterium]
MDGTTGIVLTVIFGLVALILGILNYATKNKENENKKIIKQTELEVKLANIEKELIEIKALLVSANNKYETLEKRVFVLEKKGEIK